MIDRATMRSLLESMERVAEETLQQDSAFYEAVRALKQEIDNDPQVQATVGELRAAGRSVFSSFVPHIKIRVRTEEGVFALPKRAQITMTPAAEQVGRLTQELKSAASAVIKKSRYYHELDAIVNEAVGANDRFEGIAAEIENAGHEVLICLDLSAYVEVQGTTAPPRQVRQVKPRDPKPQEMKPRETKTQIRSEAPFPIQLSGHDRQFLKGLGIKTDES
jgi:hypothetical protein